MADNSSNNSSGPRNWRDRVGVKGGMPKLADEFKKEPTISAPPAPEQPREQSRQSAPAQPAGRPAPKPIARPAPMAPRRPKPGAPATTVAPQRPAAPKPAPDASASTARSNAFAERLRAQREAAEALAKKRADETRDRLAGAASTGSSPKFSFSDEEIKAAADERTVPAPAAPAPATPAARPAASPVSAEATPPRPPYRPRHTDAASTTAPAYQPSDAYRQTHGYREYDEAAAAPTSAPAHDRYASEDQTGYTPPSRGEYQVPQSRNARYGDNELFDDRPETAQQGPRRAGASDYTAAYRDYDDAFDYDEEPRSRGGIWVFVVLMLIVVAAIAAGAYWFINYGTKIGTNTPTGGNVPTVTAPEQPVKVAPKPIDSTTPGAPVRRKKIYDRILGNETLEPEKLIPSEETPQAPPVVIPAPAPAGEAPTGVQPLPLPLPPPPTLPGVQGSIDAPLVTPAGTGKTSQVAGVTSGSGKTGQTVIAPTAAQQTSTVTQTGGQTAPLALPPATSAPVQSTTPETVPVTAPVTLPTPPLPRRKPATVVARARQAAEQSRLAALTRSVAPTQPSVPSVPVAPRQALTGTGPVQLTPGTTAPSQNFGTPTAPTTPRQPNTNIASLPQPAPPAAAPQQPAATGGGYVLQMATFRNRNAASAEYRRLISRHAGILRGLSPQITEGDLGVSGKFYKLRLGSVASRGQASQLCNALIAAGEKDCLVRSR